MIGLCLFTAGKDEASQDKGKPNVRYTKSQARQRYKKGKL